MLYKDLVDYGSLKIKSMRESSYSINKKLFALPRNGKNKTVEEICTNLKTLIKQLRKGDCVSYEKINNLDIILPKFKVDSEKEMLKALAGAYTEYFQTGLLLRKKLKLYSLFRQRSRLRFYPSS